MYVVWHGRYEIKWELEIKSMPKTHWHVAWNYLKCEWTNPPTESSGNSITSFRSIIIFIESVCQFFFSFYFIHSRGCRSSRNILFVRMFIRYILKSDLDREWAEKKLSCCQNTKKKRRMIEIMKKKKNVLKLENSSAQVWLSWSCFFFLFVSKWYALSHFIQKTHERILWEI